MSTASVASGLRLRPAQLQDARFLVDLRNRLADHFLSAEPATVEKTVEMLAEDRTFVMELNGQLAGSFALYRPRGDRLEFGRFMLEPRLHGNGYGRVMLRYALEVARTMGARHLRLVTKPQNWAAIELYGEMGFGVTQIRMELRLD